MPSRAASSPATPLAFVYWPIGFPDPVLQSIAAENNLADLQEGLGISKTSDF